MDFDIVQIRHLIPASVLSCARTLESTSSVISSVPCWWVQTGTSARWLLKNSCLWDNNKLQAARRIPPEPVVIFRTRSSLVRINESRPKSKDHWIPWLETEKTLLLYRRKKMYILKLETKFWLSVSASGKSTRLCRKWKNFCFSGSRSGVVDCDWRRKFIKKEGVFHFRCHDSSFWANNVCHRRQTTKLSVSCPWKGYIKCDSKLRTFYSPSN